MDNLYNQKILSDNNLFDDNFLDTKILFLHCFNVLPNINYVNQLDGEKAFAAFVEKFSELIVDVYKIRWYNKSKKQYTFSRTIIILKNNFLMEFEKEYCEISHDGKQAGLVDEITSFVLQFKQRRTRPPQEINLIVQSGNSLYLKPMEIKRTKLNIGLFYEDNFIQTDELIRKRLKKMGDKGIVLLHGVPGSGKTSYLRYLIGKIKKKVMFMSPSVAGSLMNPEFIELLVDNPNSVLIIEDAENIIMDRKQNSSSAVSNLLNISDGLLADFLNVQIICTFNSSLHLIDNALMRKGRLIAKHEFGKLSVVKAQKLSYHFGFDTIIKNPMTIAEISNQHEREIQSSKIEVIGFRNQQVSCHT